MLIRTFLDERRNRWARVQLVDMLPDRPGPPAGDAEDRAVIHAALTRVPPRQRAVLVLRYLYDLPVEEVAELLGCSAGTVKSQTSHGLNALRKVLDGEGFLPQGRRRHADTIQGVRHGSR
jgi:RNA polymerase sigma factor (sigma-70 family)